MKQQTEKSKIPDEVSKTEAELRKTAEMELEISSWYLVLLQPYF